MNDFILFALIIAIISLALAIIMPFIVAKKCKIDQMENLDSLNWLVFIVLLVYIIIGGRLISNLDYYVFRLDYPNLNYSTLIAFGIYSLNELKHPDFYMLLIGPLSIFFIILNVMRKSYLASVFILLSLAIIFVETFYRFSQLYHS